MSNARLQWTLVGPQGTPVLQAGAAIVGQPTAGTCRINVPNAKTATLPPGLYFDALQATIGTIVSPLWVTNSCCR